MRAAPAVQVSVTRFGVWRGAVATALALVWLVVGAWLVSHGRVHGGLPPLAVASAAAVALASATFFAAGLAAVTPFSLRWDGAAWYCASTSPSNPTATAADAVPGDLRATLDLGAWLLLRFVPERPATIVVPRWLPVQRRGLEPAWHALRCAVHSPRPAAETPQSGASAGER